MNLGAFGVAHGILQDLLLWLVPIGVGFDWWDDEANVPRGYILPTGQDIEQAKYPRLYARWTRGGVHKYGAGSVANSTKAPDKRGRASIGKDDMGGTAASRVTNGVSGVTGTTLGAAGGDERLHLHAHGVTDPGTHAHVQRCATVDGYGGWNGLANMIGTGGGGASGPGSAGNVLGQNGAAITTNGAATGISIQNAGAGASQNLPPSIVCNYIIRAG